MNKAILIGRAGKDPDLTYTSTGAAVAKFSLAISRKWKDKASGEAKEETTWFNIVAWDRLAETCSQYVHKGDQVYLEGRFVSRKYTDKDNIERMTFEVVVTELELLHNKPKAESATENAEGYTGTFKGDAEFPF